MSPHLSTLALHRMRNGELSTEETARARAHLAECPRCSAVLRNQENHRAAFELQPVPEAIRAASRSAPAASRPWSRWVAWGLALAAAALVTVLVSRAPDDGVRTKGDDAVFEVWVDTPAGPAAVADHQEFSAGDRIQARFRRPSAPWVTLAGVDARGGVEIYGTWAADMDSPDWQAAPFALELDDEPGDLSLWLVFTPTRPAEAAVKGIAAGGAVPRGAEVRTLTLEKRL